MASVLTTAILMPLMQTLTFAKDSKACLSVAAPPVISNSTFILRRFISCSGLLSSTLPLG
jgi:hypothetical protein